MGEILQYFARPENGVLGIIIIMLLLTIGFLLRVMSGLVRRIDAMVDDSKTLNQAINVLQEKRILDYDRNAGALIGLGKDLINNDAAIQKTIDRIATIIENRNNN